MKEGTWFDCTERKLSNSRAGEEKQAGDQKKAHLVSHKEDRGREKNEGIKGQSGYTMKKAS